MTVRRVSGCRSAAKDIALMGFDKLNDSSGWLFQTRYLGILKSSCTAPAPGTAKSHVTLQTKRPKDMQLPERVRDPYSLPGVIFRSFLQFWDWGLTPGSVIRTLGPYGPTVIQRYARNRCTHPQSPQALDVISAPGSHG